MWFRRWWWIVVVPLLLICVWWWWLRPQPPAEQTTRLELESYGGFAYVHTPQDSMVEIAYLKDSGPECASPVDQLGVDLMVVSGDIIEPANAPATRMFDLAGAVVTFPDLEASTGTLVVQRGARPAAAPFGPANPHDDKDWEDLKWIAGVTSGQPGSDIPDSSLNPNWRNLVDGRVVLTRGTITAAHPSDVVVRDAVFEFRTPPTAAGAIAKSFRQAVTDTTMFKAVVPSDRVAINLNGATSGVTKIVVQPTSADRPVKLKLIGRHVHDIPSSIPVGDPISHFCAFYALLQPVPDASKQLIPHFEGNAMLAANRAGQPSPGMYCPGDWP